VKKLIVIGVAVVVLLGAGGGGAWWWLHRAGAAEGATAEKHEAAPDPADSGVLTLEPFLVNLADKDSPRFLRVTLRLIVAGKKAAGKLEEDEVVKVRVRSAILELLTEQTSEQLVTPEGKAALKKAILGRCAAIVTEAKVVDVLFSEFVVQF
jgi:flagellar protein FliL